MTTDPLPGFQGHAIFEVEYLKNLRTKLLAPTCRGHHFKGYTATVFLKTAQTCTSATYSVTPLLHHSYTPDFGVRKCMASSYYQDSG